jgi:hypothetical protein
VLLPGDQLFPAERGHGVRHNGFTVLGWCECAQEKGGTMSGDGSSSQPRAPARHGGAPVRDSRRPEPYHDERRQAPAAQG